VEKLLRGGAHTAVLKMKAEVCLRCGGRLCSQETAEFKPMGLSFEVMR